MRATSQPGTGARTAGRRRARHGGEDREGRARKLRENYSCSECLLVCYGLKIFASTVSRQRLDTRSSKRKTLSFRLCNACGLRWRSKNPGLDFGPRVRGSNRQQKRILKSAVSKSPATPRVKAKPHVKAVPRVKAARMTAASSLPIDLSPSAAAVDEVDRPVWLSKEFLRSGLYSNDLKAVMKRGRRVATDKKAPAFRFPLPMHYGEAMLNTETDFFLTLDIIDGWERGMFNEAVQRSKVPEAFIRIRNSKWTRVAAMVYFYNDF